MSACVFANNIHHGSTCLSVQTLPESPAALDRHKRPPKRPYTHPHGSAASFRNHFKREVMSEPWSGMRNAKSSPVLKHEMNPFPKPWVRLPL